MLAMGSVYPRGNVLWLAYQNAAGKRVCKSSGLLVGHEPDARATLAAIERQVAAELRAGEGAFIGPPTVGGYARRFIKARKLAGVGIAGIEEARFRDYVFPFEVDGTPLESLPLKDIRPHHVRDFVQHLKALRRPITLAPRTIRAIYGQLRVMFHEAVTDELIAATPCVLKKGVLPKKVDKDPEWRPSAVFAREEVESLLSDERISGAHRVRYACLFLSGMRIGELAARRWRDIDLTSDPLGRLAVATSFNRKEKRVKGVKTERPRQVPIHPTLARVLAAWKLSGWEAEFGRPPKPDDLLCPSATLGNLRDPVVLRELHADCVAVGLRPRRTHDSRRTFISLARADGANKDILRQVTHQPEGDQVDEYTTLPWATLCAEVAKLRIKLLDGKLLALPVAVNSGDGGLPMLQSLLQSNAEKLKAKSLPEVEPTGENGRGGTRTLTQDANGQHQRTNRAISGRVSKTASSTAHQAPIDRSNVADALSAMRAAWLETGSEEALVNDLFSLVEMLGGGAK